MHQRVVFNTLASAIVALFLTPGLSQAQMLDDSTTKTIDDASLTELTTLVEEVVKIEVQPGSPNTKGPYIEYVAKRFLKEAAGPNADLWDWLPVLLKIGSSLPDDLQQKIFDLLWKELTPTDQSVIDLTFEQLWDISHVYIELDKPLVKYRMFAIWIIHSDKYKQLEADDLWLSARSISAATGTEGHQARAILVAWLKQVYFDDAEKMRALGMEKWKDFSRYLLHDQGAAAQQRWADKISEVFAGTLEQTKKLSAKDMSDLVFTMDRLFDSKGKAKEALSKWVNNNPKYGDWDPRVVKKAVRHLSKIKGEEADAAKTIFAEYIGSTYLTSREASTAIKLQEWVSITNEIGSYLPDESKAVLRSKLWDAYVVAGEPARMERKSVDRVASALKKTAHADAGYIQYVWLIQSQEGQAMQGKQFAERVESIVSNGVDDDTLDQVLSRVVTELSISE